MKALKHSLVLASLSLFVLACSSSMKTGESSKEPTQPAATTTASTQAVPAATAVDELASARKIYADKCIRCHKEDGKGGPNEIDGQKIKVPDFTTEKMKKHEDAEFIEIIENGESGDGMPAFKGKLSDEEIKALVKLIRKDFQKL